jgi:hypothetical protein
MIYATKQIADKPRLLEYNKLTLPEMDKSYLNIFLRHYCPYKIVYNKNYGLCIRLSHRKTKGCLVHTYDFQIHLADLINIDTNKRFVLGWLAKLSDLSDKLKKYNKKFDKVMLPTYQYPWIYIDLPKRYIGLIDRRFMLFRHQQSSNTTAIFNIIDIKTKDIYTAYTCWNGNFKCVNARNADIEPVHGPYRGIFDTKNYTRIDPRAPYEN